MIAKYPGRCLECGTRFDAGAEIDGYVGRSGYRHAVCSAEQKQQEQQVAPVARQEQQYAAAIPAERGSAEQWPYEASKRAFLGRNGIPADGLTGRQVDAVASFVGHATQHERHELDPVWRNYADVVAGMALPPEEKYGHPRGRRPHDRSIEHKAES